MTAKNSLLPDAEAFIQEQGCEVEGVCVRTRVNRACRWPLTFWRYYAAGYSLWTSWKLTHWSIWYDIKQTHDR